MNLLSITLPDASKPIEDQDILVLFAMCIFGEARGESDTARRAVAQVVLNRASHPHIIFGSKNCGHFEANLRAVILRPGQFSSLYPADPNYHKLWFPLAHSAPQVWERCLACASAAIAAKDRADTLTANSDHYFDDSILPPSWASPAKQTVKIGRLNFFRLYLPHPGDSSPENAPPSSGSSPDASLRPFQRSEKTETQNPAADLSRGSHHFAKILPELAMTFPARPASPLGSARNEPAGPEETPAPGSQNPRPPLSSPAPKSLRALICGPRSYPWYAWGRRLSLLTGILVRYAVEHSNPENAPTAVIPRSDSDEGSAFLPTPAPFSWTLQKRLSVQPSAAARPIPESGILNSEFHSNLVLRLCKFLFPSVNSAPQRRTVNSRPFGVAQGRERESNGRFQPTEPELTNPVQPRTGLTAFSASTVRARFQPCQIPVKDQRASAPEVRAVSAQMPSTRPGSVPSSVHQSPVAVIPRSDSDEGSAFLLTSMPYSSMANSKMLVRSAARPNSESGIWNLQFVCDLVLGIWNFLSAPVRPFRRRHFRPAKQLALVPLLGFVLLATACSDMEKTAYRVLAVTQAEYESVQDKVAESAAHNLITEEQWERFQVLGHRFIAAHNSAVDAFTLWGKSKQPADTARLQAMLDLLPGLIIDINALVDSFTAPPNNSPNHAPNGATIPPSTGPAVQPQLDQPLDSDLSPARVLFLPSRPRFGSHGERLSHRGLFYPFACHPERSEGPAFLARIATTRLLCRAPVPSFASDDGSTFLLTSNS